MCTKKECLVYMFVEICEEKKRCTSVDMLYYLQNSQPQWKSVYCYC